MSDPIFQHLGGPIYDDGSDGEQDAGWYFWDETGAHYHGPFWSRGAAQRALKKYEEDLNGNDE